MAGEIRARYEQDGYLCDTHTAVAFHVAGCHKREGVLTIPKNSAEEVADRLVSVGIKAIWNFAHIDLDTPDDVIVENVHLSESLMTLSYNLSQYRQEHVEEQHS